MNPEQQEHRICCIIKDTCRRFDAEAVFQVGEYEERDNGFKTVSHMTYTVTRGRRNIRNSFVSLALLVFMGIWVVVLKNRTPLDCAVLAASWLTSTYQSFTKLTPPDVIDREIDAALVAAGFRVKYNEGSKSIIWSSEN